LGGSANRERGVRDEAWFDLGVELPEFIEHLVDEGVRLATAAARVGWDTPVPRTDWNVRDLVTHVGGVHRWATDVVCTGATDLDTAAGRDVGRGPGDDELLEWFVTGHAALVSALRSAPPDLAAETFLSAPSPLHFWARRQAHETAIHRADADAASGELSNYAPGFAQDGIIELLHGFATRKSMTIDRKATILLDATDGPSWLVSLGGEQICANPIDGIAGTGLAGTDVARADVRGSSSDLYLWLWNRDAEVVLSGSQDVADLWASTMRVRWS
jgi:uncharacterized protein (TIGR03083 family)